MMPRSTSGPKSSRTVRATRSGKVTPGIDSNTLRVSSAAMADPSASRGTMLGGGSVPSPTQ